MSYEIQLEETERIIFSDEFQADKYTLPFSLTITDKAVFLQREKHFARESAYFEKVPHSQIKQVYFKKERSLKIWVISAAAFLTGTVFSVNMMFNALTDQPGTYVSGVPFALIIFGLLLPFLAKGRRVLIIQLMNETYKWKPKFVIDKKSRSHIRNMQENIIKTFREVGIHIFVELEP